jgi:hypothetical protein
MTARVLGVSAVLAAVAAAGLGGYLAGQPSPVTAPVQQVPSTASAPSTPAPRPAAVTETEGVVAPASTSKPAAGAAASNAATVPVERPSATVSAKGRTASAARPSTTTPAPKPAVRTPEPVREPGSTARGDVRASQPAPAVVARDETPRPAVPEPVVNETPATEPTRDARPTDERPAAVVEPPPPPTPRIEEYTVPADSVIGLQLDDTVSTETARVEQRVEAHVARDVRVNGAIVIPAGSRAHGQVTVVENGGKFRERARLGVRFHTLVLGDGDSVPIQTDTIYREGDAVGQRSAARIGGSAVGGAIIGAIFGGGKGAAIGAAAGASAGTAATMAAQKSQVTLHAGSTVTVRLTSPTTVTVEREN